MHIAYLINHYPKISHSFIRREIRALEDQGFQITRISIRGWDDKLVDPADLSERERTRYVLAQSHFKLFTAVTCIFLTKPLVLFKALQFVCRLAKRADRPFIVHLAYLVEACCILRWVIAENIKHVHAHFGTNSATVAMLVHVLGGPPWSFTAHGPEEFDKAEFIGLAEKVRRCTFVVAISSFARSQLLRLVDHHYWHKVKVVHCGLDNSYLANNTVVSATISNRLVCVGRLCEQKGQLLLIDAAKVLAEREISFELVLAGDGELRPQIEWLITHHNLADVVRITGWISNQQVQEELLRARALVLPSFAEGLPVVIMEAMALRRPVISTFVGGIPELVRAPDHGWLIPAGDASALVDAMDACIRASPDSLQQKGEAAFSQVMKRHNLTNEASKLGNFLRNQCARNCP